MFRLNYSCKRGSFGVWEKSLHSYSVSNMFVVCSCVCNRPSYMNYISSLLISPPSLIFHASTKSFIGSEHCCHLLRLPIHHLSIRNLACIGTSHPKHWYRYCTTNNPDEPTIIQGWKFVRIRRTPFTNTLSF